MRLAGAYAELGQFDAALAESETVVELAAGSPFALIGMANNLAMAGRHAEAESLVEEILALARTEYVSPFAMAQPHLRLGRSTVRSSGWSAPTRSGRTGWSPGGRTRAGAGPLRPAVPRPAQARRPRPVTGRRSLAADARHPLLVPPTRRLP